MADKSGKRKVVLASGVFDLLHLGHVKFLEEAKRAGGPKSELIVIVATDKTVENTKGRKPIMAEDQRRALVESLKVVDKAMLGFETLDIGEIISKVKPGVIALGYDQEEMAKEVQNYIGKNKKGIELVRIGRFGENTLDSSSKIKQKIIDKLKS
jgi:FAD synthetase